MITRDLDAHLSAVAGKFPAVVLTGPRQSGKSTLCKSVFSTHPYASLESPDVRDFAMRDPRGFLAQFPDGAILDEIQNAPQITSYLQELIDQDPLPGKWVLTGSQNFALMQSTSQSLAGRAAILHLLPLARNEVDRFTNSPQTLDQALFTGGYPRILNLKLNPPDWLSSYVATYLERDVRNLTNIGNLSTFQRFVQLCAGRTSQLLNYSSLAGDSGITQPTAKTWMSVLEASFIAFPLRSYHGNLTSRLIKMPKLHYYDSGLVCWLLGIRTPEQLNVHPLRGAIFESWAVSEIIKHRFNRGEIHEIDFFRDRSGLEVDVIVPREKSVVLVEIKSGQTISSESAASLGKVSKLFTMLKKRIEQVVVYGGDNRETRNGVLYLPWHQMQDYAWV